MKIKELLSQVSNDLTLKECDEVFKKIAVTLMRDYVVQRNEKSYRLLEIEFYYYNNFFNDYKDEEQKKMITYPRTTPFGQWFFHSSGVDITFVSNEAYNFGGGILIRKIMDENGNIIIGSRKCEWELFPDTADAFASSVPNPHIINAEHLDYPIGQTFRHNLPKDEKRMWNFSMTPYQQ